MREATTRGTCCAGDRTKRRHCNRYNSPVQLVWTEPRRMRTGPTSRASETTRWRKSRGCPAAETPGGMHGTRAAFQARCRGPRIVRKLDGTSVLGGTTTDTDEPERVDRWIPGSGPWRDHTLLWAAGERSLQLPGVADRPFLARSPLGAARTFGLRFRSSARPTSAGVTRRAPTRGLL